MQQRPLSVCAPGDLFSFCQLYGSEGQHELTMQQTSASLQMPAALEVSKIARLALRFRDSNKFPSLR